MLLQILSLKHFLFPKYSYVDGKQLYSLHTSIFGYLIEPVEYQLYITKTKVVLLYILWNSTIYFHNLHLKDIMYQNEKSSVGDRSKIYLLFCQKSLSILFSVIDFYYLRCQKPFENQLASYQYVFHFCQHLKSCQLTEKDISVY